MKTFHLPLIPYTSPIKNIGECVCWTKQRPTIPCSRIIWSLFFKKENRKHQFTSEPIDLTNLEKNYIAYLKDKGYHANDLGRTGFLYDLIIWKDVTEKIYDVALIEGSVRVKVNFIDKFVSLGWLGYARLGRGPGGWATTEELFCVSELYPDLDSETFLVSYLKHEGQHFLDYKNFPDIPSKDMEYRAKLLEVAFLDERLMYLINSFIDGGKYDITNSHPYANYCIIRDLSEILFNTHYERNMEKWKVLDVDEIHEAAKELYKRNTENLKKGIELK